MSDHPTTEQLAHRVYGYLRAKARQRSTVTYSMLQQELGTDRPYGSITPLLDACAQMSLEEANVVLPAIVVNSATGIPGGQFSPPSGFWQLCEDQGRKLGDNAHEFAVSEQVRVYDAYGPPRPA